MKQLLYLLLFFTGIVHADTMDHYMNIATNIPKMEMKADGESQAWARSARNILELTGESIAESLTIANQMAAKNGRPLFCLPAGKTINAEQMNDLIQQSYRNSSGLQAEKDKMSVSQMALTALSQKYPCSKQQASGFGEPKTNQQQVGYNQPQHDSFRFSASMQHLNAATS